MRQVGAVLAISRHAANLGVRVVFEPGWDTRGGSKFAPSGHILHHDVSPTGRDIPWLIRDGHAALSGPLANWYVHRDGTLRVIAAGTANHAGRGSWKGRSGNSSMFGTEVANNGTGEQYTPAQLLTIDRLHLALAPVVGLAMCCSHAEWTYRKSDIGWRAGQPWDMHRFRANLALYIATQEDDMTPEQDARLKRVEDLLARIIDGVPQVGVPPLHETQLQVAGIIDGPIAQLRETVAVELRKSVRAIGVKLGGHLTPEAGRFGTKHIVEFPEETGTAEKG